MTRITSHPFLQLRRVAAAGLLLWSVHVVTPQVSRGVVIDNFSDAVTTAVRQNLEQLGKGSKKIKDRGTLRGVLGGSRQLTVRLDNPDTSADSISLWVDRSVNRLSYASSVGADGALEIVYDSNGLGLRANWSAVKGVRVRIDADASSVPYAATLTLADAAGRSATATQTVSLPGAQLVEFLLSRIRGINVRKIARVTLVIDPRTAADLELSGIETFGP